jgi:hypothetical protein
MTKTRHGHAKAGHNSSTYRRWQAMLDRCSNPKCRQYADYGGRGIGVCESWRAFESFLADMGEAPPGLLLERIDNDGDYEPGNCRWATRTEQNSNTRQNVLLSHNGRTMTAAAWARELGCTGAALRARIRNGWSVEKALTLPFDDFTEARRQNNAFATLTLHGETLTAFQWSERTGIPRSTLLYRKNAGWSDERALSTPTTQHACRKVHPSS